jgi:hypothetical protein
LPLIERLQVSTLKGAIPKIAGILRLGGGLVVENNVAKQALASAAPRVPQLVTAQNSSTENTPSCERLATIGLTAPAATPSVTSLIAGVSGFNVADKVLLGGGLRGARRAWPNLDMVLQPAD